jgi:hypothetical protein
MKHRTIWIVTKAALGIAFSLSHVAAHAISPAQLFENANRYGSSSGVLEGPMAVRLQAMTGAKQAPIGSIKLLETDDKGCKKYEFVVTMKELTDMTGKVLGDFELVQHQYMCMNDKEFRQPVIVSCNNLGYSCKPGEVGKPLTK